MSVPQPSRTLDVRALPGTREVLAYRDGGEFPVMTAAPGDALVVSLRGGAGHLGRNGRIDVIRSLDAGKTWTPPMVVADGDVDDRNPALGQSPAGTLILAYQRQGSYDETGMYRPAAFPDRPTEIMVTRSPDAGLSWTEPVSLGNEQLTKGSPFGKIVTLADGTLMMAVYASSVTAGDGRQVSHGVHTLASYVIRSQDDGATWDDPSLIAEGVNETGLVVLPDGNLLAVLRGNGPETALWTARSEDAGRTWSEPAQVTASMQHPADVIVLADGTLLLTYGNRTPPYRIEGRVSHDNGERWTDLLLTFSGPLYGRDLTSRRRTDLGYPSSAVISAGTGRRGVTIYYYNPDIPQTTEQMDTGPNGPFYQSDGYRAVAVCWDEAELLDAVRR
ncbi:MAG TPA: sialidase family protein [Thermomicrobiales bacterium]|nr:sialidase family protein [Thermomicrobiales bacterium]